MAERLVRNVAWQRNDPPFLWAGVLLAEDEQIIWTCDHEHENDIDAEFCSLDMLLICRTLESE